MNCDQCQELIQDLVDGSISQRDELILNTHLNQCMDCESVKQDLASIVSFCQMHRGEYEAPPNTQALWLRIRNVVEAENGARAAAAAKANSCQPSFLGRLMGHTWELSLPQLAASAVALVLVVSLATVVGLRRLSGTEGITAAVESQVKGAYSVNERVWQRQQAINYWNQRVELNKARWSPKMRDTFDRNMKVIDDAVANSLNELNRNPHDEVSEQMLNAAFTEKLDLLKAFSDL
jgi:anti-sigma factor RsiW